MHEATRSLMTSGEERWRRLAAAALAALALLEILWELWLAPIRPGGSLLALKGVPLVLLWPGLARGKLRAAQWAALLLPWYFAEGLVRGINESGRHAVCAFTASALGLAALAAAVAWIRSSRAARGAANAR
jgi:uncharacterized membrane protein